MSTKYTLGHLSKWRRSPCWPNDQVAQDMAHSGRVDAPPPPSCRYVQHSLHCQATPPPPPPPSPQSP
eukprot:365725-Chlamydomonas_euryale.AAC.8